MSEPSAFEDRLLTRQIARLFAGALKHGNVAAVFNQEAGLYYGGGHDGWVEALVDELVTAARREALEDAAKVADEHECGDDDDIVCQHQNCGALIEAAILALKE